MNFNYCYLGLFAVICLSACASDVKHWDMPDPSENAGLASDMMDPRAYSSDSLGAERHHLERGFKKKESPLKFSGEASFSVGSSF